MAIASPLAEIAKELSRLQRSSPTHARDLEAWDAAGREFVRWQHTTFPEIRLPPQVMFYLHDADIRMKDADYRKVQEEVLTEIIRELEAGRVPESSTKTVTFHPRWLAMAVGLLLALFVWLVR